MVSIYEDASGEGAGIVASSTGADPSTFVVSSTYPEYGKDAEHVYLWGFVLPGADPGTFKVLVGTTTTTGGYSYNGVPFENGYSQDANSIYFDSSPMPPGTDRTTFSPILDGEGHITGYSKDDRNVYVENNILPGADPVSFRLVEDSHGAVDGYLGWAKDKNHVYSGLQMVDGADPASFALINEIDGTWSGYAKDKSNVYTENFIQGTLVVSGADPATFQVVNPPGQCGPDCQYDAQDKSHKYLNGQVVQKIK